MDNQVVLEKIRILLRQSFNAKLAENTKVVSEYFGDKVMLYFIKEILGQNNYLSKEVERLRALIKVIRINIKNGKKICTCDKPEGLGLGDVVECNICAGVLFREDR